MTMELKSRIAGTQINRVRWLYDDKEHQWTEKNGHTRGSVIASLPVEALQREVIRYGIVMDLILYTAQLLSPRAQFKQCFNCRQWGHTRASCNKARRCGGCAGTHQTRDCPKKSVLRCNWQGPLIVVEREVFKLRVIQGKSPAVMHRSHFRCTCKIPHAEDM